MLLYSFVVFWLAISALADDTFIIGGNDVTDSDKYPWQGSMRTDGSHSCGISLLSPTWGLTAAHCLEFKDVNVLSFMFGTNKRYGDSEGIVVGAKRKIVHEKYGVGVGMFPNDIALIEFDAEVKGENIASIPLTPAGAEHGGTDDCWITGWGYTDGMEVPELLQEAHIEVLTLKECRDYWGFIVYDGLVCIADFANNRGVCNGDSGGPLVCKVNGRYELVGATSWAPAGCATDMPAGYTRVAYFREWIEEKSGL